MRTLQRVVVRRVEQWRVTVEQEEAFLLVLIEQPRKQLRARSLEDVNGVLVFLSPAKLSVRDPVRPGDVEDVADAGEEHRDPLEAIGQLGGDRRQLLPSGLLEVGELRDLHAVHHDLPADTRGAEGR